MNICSSMLGGSNLPIRNLCIIDLEYSLTQLYIIHKFEMGRLDPPNMS